MGKNILKVFSSNLIKVFSTVIVTFFLPKFLSIDNYAYIKLYQLYVSYIGVFSLGYNDGIFLKYGDKKADTVSKSEVAIEQTTIASFQIFLTGIIVILSLITQDKILFFWGLAFFPTTMFTYYTYMYQALGDFSNYARLTNRNSIFNLVVNIVLLFVLRIEQYEFFVLGYCIVSYIMMIYASYQFNRNFKLYVAKFSYKIFFTNIQSGILLMLGNWAYIFFVGIDKWFVKILIGIEAFAMYSFSTQLLTVVNMFITPVALTLYSYFGKNKDNNFERTVREVLLIVLMYMLNFVYVFKFIIEIYIEKYIVAIDVIMILFVSQIFLTLNTAVYVNLFKVYKLQKKYFSNLMWAILLSIVFNAIGYFVYKNNIGIAMATLSCMIIWTLLNMMYFKYTRFAIGEVVYIICTIIVYMATLWNCSTIEGMIIYLFSLTIFTVVLRGEHVLRVIEIIRKKT